MERQIAGARGHRKSLKSRATGTVVIHRQGRAWQGPGRGPAVGDNRNCNPPGKETAAVHKQGRRRLEIIDHEGGGRIGLVQREQGTPGLWPIRK